MVKLHSPDGHIQIVDDFGPESPFLHHESSVSKLLPAHADREAFATGEAN